jgi:hypothetical protein
MAFATTAPRMAIPPMPRTAMDAALATFARVARERHPSVVVLPLSDVGPDRPVASPPPGQVIWPFAAPEDGANP